MEQAEDRTFKTLKEQYQHLGLPIDLIDPTTDFTIFNLADLGQSLPFRSPVNRLDFYVFIFTKKASGQYLIDNHTFKIEPNTIYFTNPGHYRSFEYRELEETYLITLRESYLKENVETNILEEFPFLLAETYPSMIMKEEIFSEFERIYLQIHKEYNSNSPFRLRLIGSLFLVLLLKFKEYFWLDYNPIYEGDRSSEIVKTFKRSLEKHYRDLSAGKANQIFRIQDYAEAQNLHPNYINNVIKSKTGKAIGMWIIEKTIAEAKSLLQHSVISVKEIAYKLGFADPAHFNTYFKKYVNVSPAMYRKTRPARTS